MMTVRKCCEKDGIWINLTSHYKVFSLISLNSYHKCTTKALINVCPDKPEGVTIVPVNATAIRISWSGSYYLSTCIQVTVIYASTTIIRQYEIVVLPGVTSAIIVLGVEIIITHVYVYRFSLYYFGRNDVTRSPASILSTTVTFTFGNYALS